MNSLKEWLMIEFYRAFSWYDWNLPDTFFLLVYNYRTEKRFLGEMWASQSVIEGHPIPPLLTSVKNHTVSITPEVTPCIRGSLCAILIALLMSANRKADIMSRGTTYSISVEDAEIIVRLGRDKINPEMLSRFLDYLKLETIRKRSQLTEKQAAALADDIDRAVWDNLRPSFTQEGGGADSTTGDC